MYLRQRKRKSKPSGSEAPDMDAAAVTDVLDDDSGTDLVDKLAFLEPYVSIKRSTSNLVIVIVPANYML